MLPFAVTKGHCVGCSVCVTACPMHCIQMRYDEEGFLYPHASDQCIHCNKCEQVCPQKRSATKNKIKQEAFAACSRNKKIWTRSSSGGAFSEICHAFGDEETLFVGAAWENFYVRELGIIGFKDLDKLCRSKYIASEFHEKTFYQIRSHLLKGKKVVFCGTPCQVAAVKSFLGKDYDNLLLIDLICHGIGSPFVFQTCIKLLEKQFSKQIISYEFRTKRNIFERDYLQKVTFIDNSVEYLSNDPFMQLFLSQHCLRPSCGENCIYRNEYRQGDITIGDFKGLAKVYSKLSGQKKNFSTIVLNSEKGKEILAHLRKTMRLFPCSMDDVKMYNPLFYRQTYFSNERDKLFNVYTTNKEQAIMNWTTPASIFKKTYKRKLYDLLPVWIRGVIWRRYHRK